MTYQRSTAVPVYKTPVYWLADQQQGMLETIYQHEPSPDPVRLFEETAFSPQANQSPLLFSLSPDGCMLDSLVEQPTQFEGLLIFTEASRNELLEHLRSLLEVRFQQHRKALLRYYDPRVASYLFPSCMSDELVRWLGPAEAFVWFGGTWADEFECNLSWQMLSREHSEEGRDSRRPLSLSGAQLQRLVDQGLEYFAWNWLRKKPDLEMSQLMEWIKEGIAAGHDENASLSAWLDARESTAGEQYV